MAKMVVRTCTLRTSLIILRCALVTKPAEVGVIRAKYGQAVATLYHTAFLARNGQDMCNDANYNWARCYFNRVAGIHLKLQLHELRHVWVAVSQAVASSVADRVQCAKTKQLLANAAARMSNHSPQTEEGEYAGQADISGVEQQDRKAYKALSMEFNCRVFLEARPAPDLPGRTSAPLPAGHELAMMQLSSSSQPPPSSLLADQPPTSFPSFLHARLPVSASAPAQILVAASAQQASKSNHHPNQPSSSVVAAALNVADGAECSTPVSGFPPVETTVLASFERNVPSLHVLDVEEARGSDLLDPICNTMVTTDQVIEATDYKSAVRKRAVDAINRNEVVLLAQKPGFGKTRLMLEMCTLERFTMVFTPTKPLQKQVKDKTRTHTHAQSLVRLGFRFRV